MNLFEKHLAKLSSKYKSLFSLIKFVLLKINYVYLILIKSQYITFFNSLNLLSNTSQNTTVNIHKQAKY